MTGVGSRGDRTGRFGVSGLMTPTRVAACLLVLALLACSADGIPGPPEGLPHALATNSCSPADGAAVAVYLSGTPSDTVEPAAPFVRVAAWGSLASLIGRTIDVSAGGGAGGAWYVPAPNDFELATTGTLRITAVLDDGTVEGALDVRFPVSGRMHGGFRAAWRPRTLFCG